MNQPPDSSPSPEPLKHLEEDRVCVEIRIYPGTISPDDVTTRLGVDPTRVVRKGEATTNSLGRTRVGKLNGWFLMSEENVPGSDVSQHFDWLLERLEGKQEAIARILAEPEAKAWIDCIVWTSTDGVDFRLSPAQFQRLADLNLTCIFSMAFWCPDDDE